MMLIVLLFWLKWSDGAVGMGRTRDLNRQEKEVDGLRSTGRSNNNSKLIRDIRDIQ